MFKLTWGDSGIFFYQQGRFEYTYYIFLKKFLKKILKKGSYTFGTRKYWIFIRPNMVLSKKSKNSRMGKGKGGFVRRAFKSRIFSPLIEFMGVDYRKVLKFKHFLQTKINVKLLCAHRHALSVPNLGKPNISLQVFKKYNFL